MALFNLFAWSGAACGAADKPAEKPAACGACFENCPAGAVQRCTEVKEGKK